MVQRKKNILFLCSWYPCRTSPANGDFIERHIQCLENEVNKRVLAVVEDPNLQEKWFDFSYGTNRDVPHLIIYYKKVKFPLLKFLLKFIAYFRGYFTLKKQVGTFDLIHVHVIIDAGFIAYLIHLIYRTPYIITEHSTIFIEDNLNSLPKIIKPLIRLAANKSKIILPVSNYLKENIQRLNIKTPFQIIPNVVNTDLFKPCAKRDHQSIKFLHVSAFQDFKNIPGILRAVKNLSEKRTDFSITIAGDGDLMPLIELSNQLNLPEGVVQFKGSMTEPEVAETMQCHDVFVLFSNYETFGVVLIEALATGLPVIATKIPCVMDIVNSEELGRLVPIGDEQKLEQSMNEMIDDYANFEVLKLRQRAVDFYSEAVIKQRLMGVYKAIA